MSDRITFRFLASSQDATADGASVQAGSVLEWIDKAGYACAAGWAGQSCVTAYVGNVNFRRAIRPGDVVEARARVLYTGRTSIHVYVEVFSTDAREHDLQSATDCILVFVAVDREGRPAPVPAWTPTTVEDLDLEEGAKRRIGVRAMIRDEMAAQTYSDAGTVPRTVFRFLSSPSDINLGGNAFGGAVMRWIDDAARTSATVHCGAEAVGVYSGGIHFHSPIHIGDVVEVEARPIHTSIRSVHVAIHVRAWDPLDARPRLTTQCMSVYVVTGEDGTAQPVRPLDIVSDEDRALDLHARRLIELRQALVDGSFGASV